MMPSSGPRFDDDKNIGPKKPAANEIVPTIKDHFTIEARGLDVSILGFVVCTVYLHKRSI
jgi:hypothetical protein